MSLNIIAIQGRLCGEPELKKTQSGHSICSFVVACDRSYVASGQERQTDFIPVTAWRGTAEFVAKWFKKGQMIVVSGSLQSRKWEDKEGHKRTAYDVMANSVDFCGDKGGGQNKPDEPKEQTQDDREEFAVIDDSTDLPF